VGKIIFAVITAFVAWVLFKGLTKSAKRDELDTRADQPLPRQPAADAKTPERMVKCSACGVYMPESESVMSSGKISCREPLHCAHRSGT
jgi:hypothetical protein